MLNKVVLIGRLVRDPELRYTPSEGVPVANFTIAVDRPYSKEKGDKETDFVRIVTWNKQAENCANFLTKGKLVAVEGRLQIRSYEDREGSKRSATEVVAHSVVFLSPKNGDSPAPAPVAEEYGDDDVPF